MEAIGAINLWAVLAAAVGAFVIGGIWYGPLFGKTWCREAGVSEEQAKQNGHPARVFGLAFVLSLIAAFAFALLLGPQPELRFAVAAGFGAGLFVVGAAFGINYLFAQKSFTLFLIDAGYNTLFFTAVGLVLGLWH